MNDNTNGPRDLIQAALIDSANYHDQEEWFRCLQEDGIGFSEIDVTHWGKNPKKKKHCHISLRQMHYKQLYKLAQSIFVLYNSKKDTLFANILKNKSDAIHKIGMFICNNRYSKAKGDIHSIALQGFDYKPFASKSEYDTRTTFYFLDQGMVLKHFLDMWSGDTMKEQMKPTDSDRLRAIGLLFQEEMREYIPYVLSGTDRSKRLTIDEWTGKRRLCFQQLHERFIDEEVNVTLPPKWSHENTKKKINDKHAVVGKTWDEFNEEFDPNDATRIFLPRTEDDIKVIVGTTISAYNTVMVDYTKNTGGGDGDDAAIAIWEEREEVDIVNYDRKIKNAVYLTVVHMYNKLYAFPLVVIKESIPTEFQIDDANTDNHSGLSSGRRPSPPTDNGTQDKEERAKMIEALNVIIKNDASNDDNNKDSISNQIAAVERTHTSIKNFELRLDENKKKLRRHALKSGKEKKKRKIDEEIKLTKKALKTLRKSLQVQLLELNKMNYKDNELESNDSSSDESSDNSNDDSADNNSDDN